MNLWLLAAWLVFVCSFVMPAYVGGPPHNASNIGLLGRRLDPMLDMAGSSNSRQGNVVPLGLDTTSISGWSAMEAALGGTRYAIVSATSNLVIVLSLLAVWSSRYARWMAFVAGVAVLVNLWWPIALGHDATSLSVGYYSWIASYVLAGAGLLVRSRQPGSAPLPSHEIQNTV